MKGEREGEKHWRSRDTSISYLSHAANQGPGLQPRHVPWLEIELAAFWSAGQYSIHWATPARAIIRHFKRWQNCLLKTSNSSPITLRKNFQISTKPYKATFSPCFSYQSLATQPHHGCILPTTYKSSPVLLAVSQIYHVFSYLWGLELAVPSPEMPFAWLTPSFSGTCSDVTSSERPSFGLPSTLYPINSLRLPSEHSSPTDVTLLTNLFGFLSLSTKLYTS